MINAKFFKPVLAVLAFALAVILFASIPGCANNPKPDTSQLSAQGKLEHSVDQVVKVVNDATTATIAASRTGKLTDEYEKVILTINKQVLDVIASNPTNWKELALSAIRNTRQTLSPTVNTAIDGYLSAVVSALQGVQP